MKLIEQVACIIFSNSLLRTRGVQDVLSNTGGQPPFQKNNIDSSIGFDLAKVQEKPQEQKLKSKS